jgi:rod shape-determining protein MreC
VHSALVNGGSSSGIKKDEAVTDEDGLLGRVISTGAGSARVLLLSDINSHVPVMAEHTQEKSILSGNNTDWPMLTYLPANSKIEVGERIVTSGDGGIFPPNVPVGVVTAIEDGKVKVQLFADVAKAEYVSVIDYAF